MMQSPYFTGAAPNFGPPAGMASLIAQGRDPHTDLSGFQLFADAAEQYKQQQDLGKAADYFMKASPDALGQLGIHPEQWKTLGSRDKAAAVTGLMKSAGAQEAMQRMAEMGQRMQLQQAQMNALNTKSQMEADEPEALSRFASLMSDTGGQSAAAGLTPEEQQAYAADGGDPNAAQPVPTAQRMWNAFAQMGATNPRLQAAIAGKLLPTLLNGSGEAENPVVIDKNSLPNNAIVKTAKGNAFQVVPLGSDAKPVELTDDQGNVLGHALPGPGGKMNVQWLKPQAAPKLPESFHKTMDDLSQQLQDAQNRVDASDDELKQLNPKAAPADQRAAAKRVIATTTRQAKNTIDRYALTGFLDPGARDGMYQQFGLQPPAAPAAPGTAPGKPAAVAKFQTADQVKAAWKAGQLDKGTALQILQNQFGLK